MKQRQRHSQHIAAAKTGISERSARRLERDPRLPSQRPHRHWRSRVDPFAQVWASDIEPLLRVHPQLRGVTILHKLQADYPGEFPDSVLRTLQRRIRQWRALAGPEQQVFFPQAHAAGEKGLSDFTHAGDLDVSIGGVAFPHRLYHYWLAFSHWEYAEVVAGGESFEALAQGLQNALWQAGGVPVEHRTDSLSAAFKNLRQAEDFTARYEALLAHYGMRASRNNPGASHENGAIESAHRHLKQALEQALLLRGHRDFDTPADYERFVREVVARRNRRVARAFEVERTHLRPLPLRRTTDFIETEALVTRCSTFTVKGILYSAPSRLIGHRLKVRLYSDRLEGYLGGAPASPWRGELSVPRAYHSTPGRRPQVIDYRHFIDALKRKPQALKGLSFRDALFPRTAYRQTWEALSEQLPSRQACRVMVGLLELAADEGVEAALATHLETLQAAGQLPDLDALRQRFRPRLAAAPTVCVQLPTLAHYDSLLVAGGAP